MFKNAAIIRTTVVLICFFALFLGCDQKTEAPPKPTVVAKKIVASKEVSPPPAPQKVSDVKPEAQKPAPETKAQVEAKPAPAPKPPAPAEPTTKPAAVVASAPSAPAPPEAAVKPAPKAPGEETAVTAAVEKSAEDQKAAAPAEPSLEKLVTAEDRSVYRPEGKLDPFAPLFEKEVSKPIVDKATRPFEPRKPRTPLEKVALSQLRLVGIILSPKGNKALVEEASGRGYVVEKGTYIGNRNGKIVEILNDRIIVAEEVDDLYGNVSVQKRPLQIQKPPGE